MPGDHLVIPDDAYGGTYRLVSSLYVAARGQLHPRRRCTTSMPSPAAWRDETRLVWLETPSNPKLNVIDIAAVSTAAPRPRGPLHRRQHLCHPLPAAAASLSEPTPSSTPRLSTWADTPTSWAASSPQTTTNSPRHLGFVQNSAGAVPGPFDCYLVQRGLKTLAVRLERQCESARVIAEHLCDHPAVAEVYYPGLKRHLGHELASRQMSGFGAMVSFTLKGGEAAAMRVAAGTELFTLAESLGAVESLIELPAKMTHSSVAGSELEVDPALIRLSVGLEAVEDLLEDLGVALSLAR